MRTIRIKAGAQRAAGTMIAFPDASQRPLRSPPAPDEPRGILLLFTGVRYERMGRGDAPTPPVASNGSRRRRS
ncbi:hypothetical protein [Microvirga antarctica]|uniref:hypothetical protein n=1 Tax=Microvirga antarctica TaxID=2819233 RepID=UPI001B302018|nr:hypothetical protein [Microvirga antarctica]